MNELGLVFKLKLDVLDVKPSLVSYTTLASPEPATMLNKIALHFKYLKREAKVLLYAIQCAFIKFYIALLERI